MDEDFDFSPADEADFAEFAYSAEIDNMTNPKRKRAESPPIDAKKPRPGIDHEYPASSPLARKILKDTWGFSQFRLRQEEVISRLINGGSAVVVFPTGGGKSLVYQVPALAFDEYDEGKGQEKGGVTVVVSPLIALMKVCLLLRSIVWCC
jgi:superfamily II DNA helicase RecQ